MRGFWIAGTVSVALGWFFCYLVQAVARDPLPPDVSISQYGLGPHAYLFQLWMLTLAAGPCLLFLYRPVNIFGARWYLATGLFGTAVMAIVHTDPGGLQHSVNAKIHLAGASLALGGLPIGILLTSLAATRIWRRCAALLVATSASALELLLISAAGIDTTGLGTNTSWAVWESVAVAADMVLIVGYVFAVLTLPPLATDPDPWWTVQTGWTTGVDDPGRYPPESLALRRRAALARSGGEALAPAHVAEGRLPEAR